MTRRPDRLLVIAALSLSAAGWGALALAEEKAPAAPGSARPTATQPKQAPASNPATRPAKELSAEQMLSEMLKNPDKKNGAGGARPLAPLPQPKTGGADKSSGRGAVAPSAPVVNVLREGTLLVDRVGRLTRSADGSQAEFTFEADGTSLQDPPMVIIPNLKLMQMEDAAANSVRDLRFRASGVVTEYRGRNHILLEKVVVVPEVLDRF
jgi:hypothetical protein